MLILPTELPKEITDKYSIQNNTFIQVAKDDPKDRIEVEVGDIKQPDFIPQMKISRWDEVNCSIRLKDIETGTPQISTDKDKIVWSKGNLESHFYNLTEGEGGYEFEVILKEKPKTNKIEFTLQDKGVEYFYQPELTQEEKDEGMERPEDVIGSYAVYASEQKINYVGGKEYKCGKVGHIFRPKIIDSVGTEVWGDLNIENGILSVTIPQDFLDNAVYPVVVDPTFGYTSIGVSTDSIYSRYGGTYFTLSEAGDVSKLTFYWNNSANDVTGGIAVVTGSGTGTIEGATSELNHVSITSPGWNDITFGSPVSVVADDYYLLISGSDYDNGGIKYDTVTSSGIGLREYWVTYPFDGGSISGTPNDFNHSIYATYAAAAAGPANVKSVNGVAIASVKSINGVAIASVKSINGIT